MFFVTAKPCKLLVTRMRRHRGESIGNKRCDIQVFSRQIWDLSAEGPRLIIYINYFQPEGQPGEDPSPQKLKRDTQSERPPHTVDGFKGNSYFTSRPLKRQSNLCFFIIGFFLSPFWVSENLQIQLLIQEDICDFHLAFPYTVVNSGEWILPYHLVRRGYNSGR
jgi:hypothetical protein